MESTSAKFRFMPIFEYGIGWGLGVIVTPFLYTFTRDYKLFFLATLCAQLAMAPWLHFGVFESIRWLLSEGYTHRAQIELRRACKFNRVKTDSAELAQEIAHMQVQEVRKASRVLHDELAAAKLAKALESELPSATQELDMLSLAIKRSFGFDSCNDSGGEDTDTETKNSLRFRAALQRPSINLARKHQQQTPLSPTLARASFSVTAEAAQQPPPQDSLARAAGTIAGAASEPTHEMAPSERSDSLTAQAIIGLATQYSKSIQQQEEGSCFLAKLFHRKLRKTTLLLMLLSLVYETSYYGFIQTNKFVGSSIQLNYVTGGLSEWLAACLFCLLLASFSRKFALILPTLVAALACLCLALTYHLIPDDVGHISSLLLPSQRGGSAAPQSGLEIDLQPSATQDQLDSVTLEDAELVSPMPQANYLAIDNLSTRAQLATTDTSLQAAQQKLIELRDSINFYLMNLGRITMTIGIQVAALIAMEAYPNNLRQSAPGAIILVGRIGSIFAPFLYNDTANNRLVFKATLVSLATIGLLCCLLVPFSLRDIKGKELFDRLNDIKEDCEEEEQADAEGKIETRSAEQSN